MVKWSAMKHKTGALSKDFIINGIYKSCKKNRET